MSELSGGNLSNIPQLDGNSVMMKTTPRCEESMSTRLQFQFKCDECNFSSTHEDRLRIHIAKKRKKKKTKMSKQT